MNRPYRVCVVSLGCAKNLVDTEVMCGGMLSAGFQLTADDAAADVMLINTCSFIADARGEAEEAVRAALRWKRRGRGRRVVAVAGCLPQRSPRQVAAAFPQVDVFLSLDDVPKAAEVLRACLEKGLGDRNLPGGSLPTYLYDHLAPRLTLTPASHAFVKIAEGCEHRCAYCAIPAIRGHQRSRDPQSVLAECRQLLDQGARELNLIAQDTSRYGRDRGDGSGLAGLVAAIDALPGDFWLRILYTHPVHVDDALLLALARAEHVVPYLDMPLQHISTGVLRAMRRGMSGEATRDRLARLRDLWPGVAVRTTFLVGFPGETEADFGELLEFAAEYRFDRLGVFAYSPEEGTPAAALTEGLVPHEVALARRDLLMRQQQAIALDLNQALVGRTVRVLADSEEKPGHYVGRTTADAPDIDNRVQFRAAPGGIPGHFADVAIASADAYDLHGRAVQAGATP